MQPRGAVLALLCLAQPLAAQSSARTHPAIRGWEALAVVGLTGGAMMIDQRVRHVLKRKPKQLPGLLIRSGDLLGNVRYVGPTLLAGTLSGASLGYDGLEGVSWRALESTALGAAVTLVLKSAVGRRRPDVAPNTPFSFRPLSFKGNSFPSGHTTIAFALATSLASETKDHWSDALFYAGGMLTAFARINDDKHWLSDTIVGAAVGIVSARLVQRWERKSPAGTPLPLLAVRFSF